MTSTLAYFPAIYPDELLYSAVARYLRHLGAMRRTWGLETLFGRRFVMASIDLPGHLRMLSNRLPPERNLDVDRLIDTLTLYPYYTAFVPPQVRRLVRRAMCAGDVNGMHLRLGVAAFRTTVCSTLRFCSQCVLEMRARYGELYWRRVHQLPGALVCPEHACVLRESTVDRRMSGRHDFVAATRATCPANAGNVVAPISAHAHEHLHALAIQSQELLMQPPSTQSFSAWTTFYRTEVRRVGLAYSATRMKQQELHSHFRAYYGETLIPLDRCLGDNAQDWLAALVRKHRKIAHPLRHLLLQRFIAARSSVDTNLAFPFGAGPWRCPNPLIRHRTELPVTVVSVHANHGHKVGVFTCRCGYGYTRSFDPICGTVGPARFLRFGPRLGPALTRWISQGLPLREIARRLALDPKTVATQARRLGIAIPWTTAASRGVDNLRPQASRMPSNDVTPLRAEKRRSPRRDWGAIDRKTVRDLRQAAQAIRAERPPKRMTGAELERRLGWRGWLHKRQHKLPKAAVCIARLTESLECFRWRRIEWAVTELRKTHAEVPAWKVMRLAGLRSAYLPLIRAALLERDSWGRAA